MWHPLGQALVANAMDTAGPGAGLARGRLKVADGQGAGQGRATLRAAGRAEAESGAGAVVLSVRGDGAASAEPGRGGAPAEGPVLLQGSCTCCPPVNNGSFFLPHSRWF